MSERAPAVPPHPDLDVRSSVIGFKRYLRVDTIRFRHRLFSGEWSGERTFDVLRRGEAVAVVLYDPDRDQVVLIEQFRLAPWLSGSSPWQLEAPAGMVDAGETPEAVAVRETGEETGLVPIGDPVPIQRYLPTPGGSDEGLSLFCCRIDASAAGGIHGLATEQEDIRIAVKTVAEIETLLDAGAIENGHTLVGLYWLLRHRDRLRRDWARR